MACPARVCGILAFLIVLGELAASPSLVFAAENEQELKARIARERNPVRKAKYEIRLGRLKLLQAIDAYNNGNFDQGQTLLAACLDPMEASWETLQGSGRRAARQPQGYKELEIALREDERLLADLAHRVSYFEREPVLKAIKEIDRIHNEVLKALFPVERSDTGGILLRSRAPHLSAGKVLA